MSISDYAEAQILDALFNNDSFAVANTYVQLHTGDPGEACTSNVAAHTGRVEATWAAASGGSITTDAAVTFTDMDAAETISHISIWDAATNGNALWSGALSASKTVAIGDTLNFASGDIDITLT